MGHWLLVNLLSWVIKCKTKIGEIIYWLGLTNETYYLNSIISDSQALLSGWTMWISQRFFGIIPYLPKDQSPLLQQWGASNSCPLCFQKVKSGEHLLVALSTKRERFGRVVVETMPTKKSHRNKQKDSTWYILILHWLARLPYNVSG